jgi:acyl carrier protein
MIEALASYIATEVLQQPDRVISPTEPLLSSGLIDSFSLMDLALFIEDSFLVRIEDTELNVDTFDSLQDLANLIESRQS